MEWREIPDYAGLYEVAENGDVRRLARAHGATVGKTLRPGLVKGYLKLELRKGGRAHTVLVHRLVASVFIRLPLPKEEVCHNDGNKLNNHWTNLRWDTHRSNQQDLVRHGNHLNARKTECKNGHPFDEANTYLHPTNGRVCRTCVARSQAKRRERLKI